MDTDHDSVRLFHTSYQKKLNLPVILPDKNRTKLTIFQQMVSQVC